MRKMIKSSEKGKHMLGLSPEILVEEFSKKMTISDEKSWLNCTVAVKEYVGIIDALNNSPTIASKYVSSLIEYLITLECKIIKEVKEGKSTPGI